MKPASGETHGVLETYAGEGAAAGVAAPRVPGLHPSRSLLFRCVSLLLCRRQGPGSDACLGAARAASACSTFCLRLRTRLLFLVTRGSQPPRYGRHRFGIGSRARQQCKYRWQRRRCCHACVPHPCSSPSRDFFEVGGPAACAAAAVCRAAVAATLVQRGGRVAGRHRLQGAPAVVARASPALLPGCGQPGRLRGRKGGLGQR